MGISISKVRIENFRSIENLELSLSMTNVLIGANNCGKSNFLKAINVALGQNKIVSSEDIYVGKDEVLDNTKCATIDIMLRPVDATNNILSTFSDFWIGVFTEEWITTGDPIGDYVGIRTILQYDALRNDYIVVRKQITDWGDSISSAGVSRRKAFTGDMNTYISAFYMDAQRDVVDDIKDRKSYFGRATSRVDLPQEKVSEIERLTSFRNQISLGKTRETEDSNGIALLTAHMSKGLQFDVVFIIGLSEGTFPDYRAIKADDTQLSQEMNNMYVAVTRAKRLCYMTYPAKKRMPWGDIKLQSPSRYIKDIVTE